MLSIMEDGPRARNTKGGDDDVTPSPTTPDEPQWTRLATAQMDKWPLGRLLSAAARRVEREWNAHLATWDLNHASLPVLIHLMGEPRSQRDIATLCNVTEQTMSRIVARIERSGYVTRTPHATDRRKYVIAITDAGRAVARLALDRRPAETMTTRGLTPDQVDQLRALLMIVIRATPETDPDRSGAAPGTDRDAATGTDRRPTAAPPQDAS